MPVDTKHKDYTENINQWTANRDVVLGQAQIKKKSTTYLPKLSKQTNEGYKGYLERAVFYGATSRTLQSLVGSVFRKPMMIKNEENNQEIIDNISIDNLSLEAFTKVALEEILITGRFGVLVDADENSNKPYFAGYKTENIINWKTEAKEGKLLPTLIVLQEIGYEEKDEFESKPITQLRVLDIHEGFYRVRLYQGQDSGSFEQVELFEPKINGNRLDYIPFTFISATDTTPDIKKAPLTDLVDMNLSHYRLSADYKHGLHFTALPTVVVTGATEKLNLVLGSERFVKIANDKAEVKFLEYEGLGLGALEKAIKSTEKQMEVLGARILEDSKKAVESADAQTTRKASENSALASGAGSVQLGINNALVTLSEWGKLNKDLSIELNKDYIESKSDPEMIKTWNELHQSGNMSKEVLLYNIQKSEMYPEGHTIEKEIDLLEIRSNKIPQQTTIN